MWTIYRCEIIAVPNKECVRVFSRVKKLELLLPMCLPGFSLNRSNCETKTVYKFLLVEVNCTIVGGIM